jgi:hypothetical protein
VTLARSKFSQQPSNNRAKSMKRSQKFSNDQLS